MLPSTLDGTRFGMGLAELQTMTVVNSDGSSGQLARAGAARVSARGQLVSELGHRKGWKPDWAQGWPTTFSKMDNRQEISQFCGIFEGIGGPSRNRTGVQGFAVLCVTTPPSGRGSERFGAAVR